MTLLLLGLMLCTAKVFNISSLYQRTKNISSVKSKTLLDCASKCLHRESQSLDCNAFKFSEDNKNCDLAKDPDVGQISVTVMVAQEEMDSLKMFCRGGENCCGRETNRLCAEGEGDCDHDEQCEGLLECGTNNCPTKAGGSWDQEDDCCRKKCTPDRPCWPGQGPCYSDADCLTAGQYYICNTDCIDRQYYPLDKYPLLASIYGYETGHKCCRRRCTPHSRCSHDQYGCEEDEDCLEGHGCVGEGLNRKCEDINECLLSEATAFCGEKAECEDQVGWSSNTNFTCVCITGFQDWVEYQGCSAPSSLGILIAGGYSSSGTLSSAEIFNPATGVSTPIGDLPQTRQDAPMCNNMICGGYGSPEPDRSCELFDGVSFTRLPVSLVERRDDHLCWGLQSGEVILLGGSDSGTTSEKVSADGVASSASFSLPYNINAACGIDLGDNYIVTGGYGTYNTVAMFSEAGFVKYLPNLKTSRYRHACTSFVDSNGETGLIVTGGYSTKTEIYFESSSNWIYYDTLPTSKTVAKTAVTFGNLVYVFGGYYSGHTDDIHAYDYSTNRWQAVGKMTEERSFSAIALLPGSSVTTTTAPPSTTPTPSFSGILIAGGQHGGRLSSAEVFNAETGESCAVGDLPIPNYAHSICQRLVCGGKAGSRNCWMFDGASFSTLSVILVKPRRFHLCWSLPTGEVLLIGGYDSRTTTERVSADGSSSTADFDLPYETGYGCGIQVGENYVVTGGAFGASETVAQYSVTGEVTYLANLNSGRSYHACSKYEDDNGRTTLMVMGGDSSSGETTEIYVDSSWSYVAPLPSKRGYYLSAATVNNKVFVVGGYCCNNVFDEILSYNSTKDQWTVAGTMTEPRFQVKLSPIAGASEICSPTTTSTTSSYSAFIIIGGSNYGGKHDIVETFNPETGVACIVGRLPEVRAAHTLCNNLLCGGNGNPAPSTRGQCLLFDGLSSFTPLPVTLVKEREMHMCWSLPSGDVMLLGGPRVKNTTEIVSKDGSSSTASFDLPYGIRNGCGMEVGDKFIITGGYDLSVTDGAFNTVARISQSGEVEYLATMNVRRRNHACSKFLKDNGDMALLVTGGDSNAGGRHTFLDSTEIYSFSDNSWTMAASLPSARFLHRAALLDNTIFIFGGLRGSTRLDEILSYNAGSDSWEEAGTMAGANLAQVVAPIAEAPPCEK